MKKRKKTHCCTSFFVGSIIEGVSQCQVLKSDGERKEIYTCIEFLVYVKCLKFTKKRKKRNISSEKIVTVSKSYNTLEGEGVGIGVYEDKEKTHIYIHISSSRLL
jgi:hypothetical protein